MEVPCLWPMFDGQWPVADTETVKPLMPVLLHASFCHEGCFIKISLINIKPHATLWRAMKHAVSPLTHYKVVYFRKGESSRGERNP